MNLSSSWLVVFVTDDNIEIPLYNNWKICDCLDEREYILNENIIIFVDENFLIKKICSKDGKLTFIEREVGGKKKIYV
jgi:hypothetical protein